MNLYLIKTEKDIYATNANSKLEANEKFYKEYPDYNPEFVKQIPVESLVRMEDNDSIIFF